MARERGKATLLVGLATALLVGAALWWWEREPHPAILPAAHGSAAASSMASVAATQGESGVAREIAPPTAAHATPAFEDDASESGIRVLVVDPERNPVSDAVVTPLGTEGVPAATTGPDGACALAVPRRGRSIRLQVEAPGFCHRVLSLALGEEITVTILPSTRLLGVVVDAETRRPVPGARVTFEHDACGGCEAEVLIAGDRGEFEIPRFPIASERHLKIGAEGYPTQYVDAVVRGSANTWEHVFELERGVKVRGRVTDLVSGAPVPGAVIRCGLAVRHADQTGRFAMRLLTSKAGMGYLLCRAPDYVLVSFAVPAEQISDAEPLHVRLPAATTVVGVVRDPAGQPIDGVGVWVERVRGEPVPPRDGTPLAELPASHSIGTRSPSTEIGEHGAFRVSGVPPWSGVWEVQAHHPDYQLATVRIGRIEEPRVIDVDITLVPESRPEAVGVIEGRVTLNGKPHSASLRWRGPRHEGRGKAGSFGRFRLEDVEAGSVDLQVTLPQLEKELVGSQARQRVDVIAEREHLVRFDLEVPFAPISGRVTWADGRPVQRAAVGFVADGYEDFANADSEGRYELAVPRGVGPFRIVSQVRTCLAETDGVDAGARGVDLVLPLEGNLRFRVLDADEGGVLETVSLYFWQAGELTCAHTGDFLTPTDGWFLAGTPAGSYDVHVQGPRNYVGQRLRGVVIEPHATTELSVSLQRGLSLALKLAADQEPPPGSLLLIEDEYWASLRVETSEHGSAWVTREDFPEFNLLRRAVRFRQGAAKLRGLPAGRYRFKVLGEEGIAIAPEYVEVAEGQSDPIEVSWSRQ